MKKLTKKELRERLQMLINTVNSDLYSTEQTIVDNETWSESDGDFIQLDRSARVILLDKKLNEDHIIKRLIELLSEV